jgi:hypothetical protein
METVTENHTQTVNTPSGQKVLKGFQKYLICDYKDFNHSTI